MPRKVTVTFANGQQVVYENAPDDITPDQVISRAQQEHGGQVVQVDGGKPAANESGKYMDAAGANRELKFAGTALAQGLAGLVELPFKLGRGLAKEAIVATPEQMAALESGDPSPSDLIDIPATTPREKYEKSILQAVGGGVGPGMVRAPATALASAVGSGAGSQFAADLTSDNALSRIIGGVLGGVPSGAAMNAATRRLAPNTTEIAREMVEGLSPEDLAKAQRVMEEVKKNYGIDLDLSQALDMAGNTTAVRDVLANSKYGNRTQAILREQPRQAIGVSNTEMTELPGQVLPSMQAAANEAQETATKFIQQLKQGRKEAVDPIYASASALPGTNKALTSTIDNLLTDTSIQSDTVRRDLRKLKSELMDQKQTRAQRMKEAEAKGRPYRMEPVTSAQELNDILKNFWGQYKDKSLMMRNANEERQAGIAAKALREVFDQASEDTKAANQLYGDITRETINPAMKSPMGRLATPKGAMPDREAALSTLTQIFERGTDPRAGGTSEILTMAKSFKKVDPTVFNDAAKTWLSGKLANAVKINEDGVIDPTSMARIKDSLYTTPAQRQGMRDVLAGMADNAGLPRQRVVGAFEGFMDVMSKTAKRPEKVGGLQAQDIAKLAGKSKLADAIRFWGFTANMTAGRRIEERVLGKTMQELDKLLTTKEGVEYLQRLAQDGYVSPRAVILGTTALSSLGQAELANQRNDEEPKQ